MLYPDYSKMIILPRNNNPWIAPFNGWVILKGGVSSTNMTCVTISINNIEVGHSHFTGNNDEQQGPFLVKKGDVIIFSSRDSLSQLTLSSSWIYYIPCKR